MNEATQPTSAESSLRLILRLVGSSSLLALIFVAAPHDWMNSIHAELGLGPLPEGPIVGYLARSTSAFYALLGGLFWIVSFDLDRHRFVLTYLGVAVASFGLTLLVVDWWEGLPRAWVLWEGPFVMVLGVAVFSLARRIGSQTERRPR